MPLVDDQPPSSYGGDGNGKVWGLFKLPFWSTNNSTTHTTSSSSSSSSYQIEAHNNNSSNPSSTNSVSSVARSLLPIRRRLRLDPPNKLYFPCTNT
ncbi:hypothetical protein HanLR1_Chr00c1020g0787611 [Helianthus annuus]|nr:hypothetical protein HanLR1_Chr00c1020g0787611 [Helianthus annuus]